MRRLLQLWTYESTTDTDYVALAEQQIGMSVDLGHLYAELRPSWLQKFLLVANNPPMAA